MLGTEGVFIKVAALFLLRFFKQAMLWFKLNFLDGFLDYLLGPLDGFTALAKRRIARIVSRVEGESFSFSNCYRLEGASSSDADRSFWVVELLSASQSRFSVFVKISSVPRRGVRISQALSGLNLPTPFCYGSFVMRGRGVALWQYQDGFSKKFFHSFTDVELVQAARAIASYNFLGAEDKVRKIVGVAQFWSGSVSAQLKEFVTKFSVLRDRVDVINCYVRFEGLLLKVLLRDSQICLNHNDFKASNILFLHSGECVITDFDSASFGCFGVSLRCFAVMPLERRLLVVNEYVKRLKELGVVVSPESIHQVMCAQQILWALHTGIRLGNRLRVERGLNLFCDIYLVKGGKLFLNGVGELQSI